MEKSTTINELLKQFNSQAPTEVPADFISGISSLDTRLGGFQFGELVLVGSSREMGKTIFLLRVALNVAQQKPVLIYSFEDNHLELLNHLISLKNESDRNFSSDYSPGDISNNFFENEQIILGNNKLDSFESFMLNVFNHVFHNEVKIVFIDHLELLPQPKGNKSLITLLKKMCSILKITFIITQLQPLKNINKIRGKLPSIRDFHFSPSDREQINTALIINRLEYYGIMEDEKGNKTQGKQQAYVVRTNGKSYYNDMVMFDFLT